MSEHTSRTDKLIKLVKRCEELELVEDDDLKDYFKLFTVEAKQWLENSTYHEEQNALSPQLLAAWKANITPITGVDAIEARWNDDRFWYEIAITGFSDDDILLGYAFEDALTLITSKSQRLLRYTPADFTKE